MSRKQLESLLKTLSASTSIKKLKKKSGDGKKQKWIITNCKKLQAPLMILVLSTKVMLLKGYQ